MGCQAARTLACFALAVTAPRAFAQAPAQSPQPQSTETTTLSARSTLVLVPALVRNKSGELIFTLTADDFTLTDDGVPQKLTLEQDTGGEPLALVIDIEGGGAGAHQLDKYRAIAPMLDALIGGEEHRVAVVGFDSSPVLVQDFTPDTDKAASAVQALIADDSGDSKAAILDSIGFSVDLLRKQPAQYRRAILLLSETLDRGSKSQLADALRAISDTNTAIYSIGFSSGKFEAGHEQEKFFDGKPGPDHGCMAKDHSNAPDTSNNRAMQAYDCLALLAPPLMYAKMAVIAARDGFEKNVPETIAHLTGGEYFKLTNEKSLERDLQTISNHISNRYVLSFQPQSPHPGYHAIVLNVPNYKNLDITARSSYWADTDAPPATSPQGPHP